MVSKTPTRPENGLIANRVSPESPAADSTSQLNMPENHIQSRMFPTYFQAATAAKAFNKRIARYQEWYGLHLPDEKASVDETGNGWCVNFRRRT